MAKKFSQDFIWFFLFVRREMEVFCLPLLFLITFQVLLSQCSSKSSCQLETNHEFIPYTAILTFEYPSNYSLWDSDFQLSKNSSPSFLELKEKQESNKLSPSLQY